MDNGGGEKIDWAVRYTTLIDAVKDIADKIMNDNLDNANDRKIRITEPEF